MVKCKKKPIEVRKGYIKVLAKECRVSPLTVRHALRWQADTDIQNLIRERAKKYLKRF